MFAVSSAHQSLVLLEMGVAIAGLFAPDATCFLVFFGDGSPQRPVQLLLLAGCLEFVDPVICLFFIGSKEAAHSALPVFRARHTFWGLPESELECQLFHPGDGRAWCSSSFSAG